MDGKKLPWYLRLILLLPIFLCISVSVGLIIHDASLPAPQVISDSGGIDEEQQRGQDILNQYEREGEPPASE